MPIAHICTHCGTDLARVRAWREPHYGLMIVRCTTCETVVSRRRHPLWRFLSNLRRVDWALTVLVGNLLAFLWLQVSLVAGVAWFVDLSFQSRIGIDWAIGDWIAAVLVAILLPLLVGAYLTMGLSHWRPILAWTVFLLVALVGWTAVSVGLAGETAVIAVVARAEGQAIDPGWWPEHLHRWGLGGAAIYLLMLVSWFGTPIGRGLLQVSRRARQMVWKIRRRWRRVERSG